MTETLKILKVKNSIITKIIFKLFLFLSLFLFSIILINYNLTKKNYDKIEQEKIDVILNNIKSSLTVNISFEFKDAVDETLTNLVENKNIITIELFNINKQMTKKFTNKNRKNISSEKQNSFTKKMSIRDPLTNKDIAILTIFYSKDHRNELLKEYYLWMGFIILLYTIVSLFFIRSISHLIKPLENIANKMNNFDPSNPQKIVNNSSYEDEINMICESSNKMIDTIDKHIKEMERKNNLILEQSKMASMGEMIGNIAHQWRQPLSVISTGATGMKMQKEFNALSDKNFNVTCEIINENAQYLSRTIDDFRNFIKGDREKVNFDFKKMINSFISLVQGSITSNNIEFSTNLDKDLMIYGYENELIQCFINIFNNSKDVLKDLNQKSKHINISCKSDSEKIIIKVRDNAGGIKPEILSKIFEPYFTTKHQSQGTGLGLHMTYKLIVEGMQGTIKAHNVSFKYKNVIYDGAEFVITIPVV